MHDQFSVNIVSFFLLLAAASLVPYLWRKAKLNKCSHGLVNPTLFFWASMSIFILTGILLLFVGFSHALLAIALALGIVLALIDSVTATCFFVAVLFTRPWEALPNNPLLVSLPRMMAALTMLAWIIHAVRNKNDRIVWNSTCILFVSLILWLGLSTFFSATPGDSFSFFFSTFSPIAVLSFLILNSLSTKADLKLFSRTLIISISGTICAAAYVTIRDYSIDPKFFRLHGLGLWGNSNDLAALIVFVLPLTLEPLMVKEKLGTIALSVISSFIVLLALVWTQSRAAQISVAVAGVSYFLFCKARMRLAFVTILFMSSVIALIYIIPQRAEEDLTASTSSRANYAIAGMKMVRAHPLFGVGISNYSKLYEQYTPAFIEWGTRTAHSSWVLILAEAGIIGFILFALLCVTTFTHAWRIRREAPQFFLLFITYGIAMSFLSHTYLFLPYVMMAFILAASKANPREQTARKPVRAQPSRYLGNLKNHRQAAAALLALILTCASNETRADEVASLSARSGIDKPVGRNEGATSSSIALKGSRSEILSFLLKVEGDGCSPLSVDIPDSTAQSLQFAFFSLPEVITLNPSYPGAFVGRYLDPVVPIADPKSLCIEDNSQHAWFLGELNIGAGTVPGEYTVKISVDDKIISVAVTVWQMQIPEQPAIPAYAEMTPWFSVLGHFGKWDEQEAQLAVAYVNAMSNHRIYPLKSIIAPLEFEEEGNQQLLTIDQKPSPQSAFRSIVLKHRPLWAYFDFPTVGSSGFEKIDYAKAEQYFRAVENTIGKINRPEKAIVYLWDEPKPEVFPELVNLSKSVKKWAPSLKQLVTITYSPALKDTVDIFAPVMDQYDAAGFAAAQLYRQFQKFGGEVWWYISCMSHGCEALADSGVPDMVIDRSSSYVRSIAWLSMKYNINAFLYYSVNNGFQYSPKRDPWKSLWDFSGNGDGTLFYPGRPGEHGLTQHQPVASLRLKLWRESSYDAEYIKWMNALPAQPAWWNSEFNDLVGSTKRWQKDYQRYQRLRDKAGEFLQAHQGRN